MTLDDAQEAYEKSEATLAGIASGLAAAAMQAHFNPDLAVEWALRYQQQYDVRTRAYHDYLTALRDEHAALSDEPAPGGIGSEDWALEGPGYRGEL